MYIYYIYKCLPVNFWKLKKHCTLSFQFSKLFCFLQFVSVMIHMNKYIVSIQDNKISFSQRQKIYNFEALRKKFEKISSYPRWANVARTMPSWFYFFIIAGLILNLNKKSKYIVTFYNLLYYCTLIFRRITLFQSW